MTRIYFFGIFNIGGTSVKIIGVQVLGIAACFLWVFPAALIMFKLIDKTVGLRVSAEEELAGLDYAEHGGNAYPDFEILSYGGIGSSDIVQRKSSLPHCLPAATSAAGRHIHSSSIIFSHEVLLPLNRLILLLTAICQLQDNALVGAVTQRVVLFRYSIPKSN